MGESVAIDEVGVFTAAVDALLAVDPASLTVAEVADSVSSGSGRCPDLPPPGPVLAGEWEAAHHPKQRSHASSTTASAPTTPPTDDHHPTQTRPEPLLQNR